jgi:DNA (cytosine-5)-methyltransferase 1
MNAPPRIGSLCSGYGGLDMAARDVLGGSVVWHVENDPNASAILAHHWPDVPNLGDLAAADFAEAEPVDVLTAGFPCQDVSLAGHRAGIAEGTRSGLWRHVARAIASLRPSLVVIENVRGLLSASAHSHMEPCPWCMGDASREPSLRALGAVLGDLAGLGFDAEWCCLRAAEIGAAHHRERVFVLAWPAAEDADLEPWDERRLSAPGEAQERQARAHAGGRSRTPAADPGRHPWPQDDADGSPAPRGGRTLGDPARQSRAAWGPYAAAVERWQWATRRTSPRATDDRGRLNPRFVEWLMGLPPGHVTDVPGLSRSAQLKALGNGVVPQQAAAALRLLLPRTNALDLNRSEAKQ